jgi:glutathione synthase/RimK-type ligase-like ATP-grasp enzyme
LTGGRIALATCAALPDLDEDGPALLGALHSLGLDARAAVWDDPTVRWDTFDLVVLRSTWDYVERRHQFVEWARSVPRLVNPAPVVAWNTDKHYLADLAAAGVPTVESVFLEPSDLGLRNFPPPAFAGLDFVVKPAVGAGSRDAARYRPSDRAAAADHVAELHADNRSVLVQPYLDSVDEIGESALIYLGGTYSHAICKAALLDGPDRHVDGMWREETISARQPGADELAAATRAMAAVGDVVEGGHHLAYARVDLVRSPGGVPLVLELELTEPSLFMEHDDGAAQRFAAALAARAGAGRLP